MFKALHKAAQTAPVIIRVSTEGDGLRLIIHQKADEMKDGEIPLALSVVGSADMLEFELPAAIHQAIGNLQNATSVADQVAQQTQHAIAAAAAVKPKKTAAKALPPAVKKAAPAKAPPHKRPATQTKKPAPKAEKPVKHVASKPTAEDCINAFLTYNATTTELTVKREHFIKNNPTGRRFERLFGNWEKFVAAARKAAAPNGDTLTQPLPLETAPASETAAAAPARTGETAEAVPPAALSAAAPETLPEVWPFPATAGATA